MKISSHHLASITCGFVGFLAMAVMGWNHNGGTLETVRENSAPSSTRSSRERPVRSSGARDDAAAKLASIRSETDPSERLRATIHLAEALPLSEFGKWLIGGWFTLREGEEFTLFRNILRDRWLKEDPEGFALWTIKNNWSDSTSLLVAWTEGQPEKFFDFFRRHPDNFTEFVVLTQMARDQPDFAFQALMEMNAAGISDRDLNGSDASDHLFQILAEKSPAAYEAALAQMKEPVRSRAEWFLRKQKFKTDPIGELHKLFDRPDGFDVYYGTVSRLEGIPGKLVDDLANLPPSWCPSISRNAGTFIDADNAEKWWNADLEGVGFSEPDINSIRKQALLRMAEKSPEIAFQRLTELELSDEDTKEIQMGMIGNALRTHRDAAAKLIELLPQGEDREIAAGFLAETPDPHEEQAAGDISTPEQWLEKATASDSNAPDVYGSLLKSWTPEKLASLGAQFRTLPDEQKQRVAKIISGSSNDHDSFCAPVVGEAIRYLLAHPPSDAAKQSVSEVRSTSAYAMKLAVKEPETGRDWVDSLPEGQPKLWASKNLFLTWSEYDPAAAGRWLKTLPAATQAEVKRKHEKPSR